MKYRFILITFFFTLITTARLIAQSSSNCFLEDFEPKNASIPSSEIIEKPTAEPTVTLTVLTNDTLGQVSKYVFGNAMAVWVGNGIYNPTLVEHLQKLAPTLIRYPGGSWSDIFFWNGVPTDIPDSLYNASLNKMEKFWPQSGTNSWPTTKENYYNMRLDVDTEGLITINYGYARYGTSADPVAKAAHLAADWVRYDDGRTKFWEIGNECGGPWEAGWQIDTTLNQDNQPMIITGELYGKHFKVFADSMRAAAEEIGEPIYIGGVILHYDGTNSWNSVDKKWNEGFFKEVGDAADFYVMHNYFGTSATAKSLLDVATTEPQKNIDFIRQDIINKNAPSKPVALTEWNMQGDNSAYNLPKTSIINGMQAVIIMSELIKNNFGMSARWLIANGADGMFYDGGEAGIPRWNPRPDFFYIYYLQQFFGDHVVNAGSNNKDVLIYASTFASGETGVVVVNKTTADQVVRLEVGGRGVGENIYMYSLNGGEDNGDFSQNVIINDTAPTAPEWGPLSELENIDAWAIPIGNDIKFNSPARSVQFILVEEGNTILSADDNLEIAIKDFQLNQNYPNPFNPTTTITYSVPAVETPYMASLQHVTLKIYDVLGREIATLVDEFQNAGMHHATFNIQNYSLPSGIYFYKLSATGGVGSFSETKKMTLLK
ncbi:MAG: T9SS type A sorting domain-containing protein [bacterium]